MSKEKEKQIDRRSRRLKGMDTVIRASDDRAAIEGWDSYIDGFDFPFIAKNEELYRACCSFFDRIDRKALWGIDL